MPSISDRPTAPAATATTAPPSTAPSGGHVHTDERPVGAYGALLGVYTAAASAVLAIAAARGRLPERIETRDLVLAAVATHKVSRRVTKDAVTRPLRAPFTRPDGPGEGPEVTDAPRGEGLRRAVGELVSCPFCLSQWTATTAVAGLVLAPRWTRTLASIFAVAAGSDALQYAYARLQTLDHER